MGERIACMIWCDECARKNWREVTDWVWSGRAVARSGMLKVGIRCGSCDSELSPGYRVDTITLHSGLMAAAEWAAEVVLFNSDTNERDEAEGV